MTALDLPDLIATRFIQRPDVKAVQQPDGSYRPERAPLTRADIEAHLAGQTTIGHYLVEPGGLARVLAFDIDLNPLWELPITHQTLLIHPREEWKRFGSWRHGLTMGLRICANELAFRMKVALGCPVAVAYSGSKGFHVYGFVGPAPAADIRKAGDAILRTPWTTGSGRAMTFDGDGVVYDRGPRSMYSIELFPKTDDVDSDGLGYLMRLPLGINRKSNERAFFVDQRMPFDELSAADPLQILRDGDTWR